MAISKENMIGNKNPLFLRFINGESAVSELLIKLTEMEDTVTAEAAKNALQKVPDLSDFREEMEEAVRDIIKEGVDDAFKAFVNNYMKDSLREDMTVSDGPMGQNRMQMAYVGDPTAPWIQGMICYNLCMYIKAFGLEDLKACRICGKLFSNKGKFAVYCTDECKAKGKSAKEG